MIRTSQLKELIQHLVGKIIKEIDSNTSISQELTAGIGTDTTKSDSSMSPVMQQKMAREEEMKRREKLKSKKRELEKFKKNEKALEMTYKDLRRKIIPRTKDEIDSLKRKNN